jgi:ABC-type dipeptide/oligopeptide/nickel transport system ATPase component
VSEPVLSVRDLKVAFPTRRRTLTAVDGISFDIAAGEVLGVVGESGAGKSLTGAAVIGLLEPPGRIVGGEVLLKGQRIDHLPPEEMRKVRGKRIGMVFQDPLTSLNPLYSVGEQIVETIRTHTRLGEAEARELLDRRDREVATSIGSALGCEVRFDHVRGYPPSVNDPAMVAVAREAGPLVVGEEKVILPNQTMGGGDFAYVLERVPGVFIFVGSANAEKGLNYPHHIPHFDFDEAALSIGADVMIESVLRALATVKPGS